MSANDKALLAKLQGMLVESYEGLSSEECERVHMMFAASRDVCEYFLDDHFARRLVDDVAQIVQRIMKFEPITVSTMPIGPVNVYFREAVRCHVHGLHQGAVTLARAAMEQGLRERVPLLLRINGLSTSSSTQRRSSRRWGRCISRWRQTSSILATTFFISSHVVLIKHPRPLRRRGWC